MDGKLLDVALALMKTFGDIIVTLSVAVFPTAAAAPPKPRLTNFTEFLSHELPSQKVASC